MYRTQAPSNSSPLPSPTAGSVNTGRTTTKGCVNTQQTGNPGPEYLVSHGSPGNSNSPTSTARRIFAPDPAQGPFANGAPPDGTRTSTSPTTNERRPSTGKMLTGGIGTPSTSEASYMGQQSYQRYSEHETAFMVGNRSIGAPTPTSTTSYGGMKEEGGFITPFTGRRESDFAGTDEDVYGSMYDPNAIGEADMPENVGSPDYGGGDGDGDGEGDGDDVLEVGEGSASGMGGSDTRDTLRMKSEGEINDQTPVWSETKTKAGKERKRLPLACIMCRRKKIRCSGERPACKHCLRSRIPCVYKQTARKTAPRTDYMAMLDRRLRRMEERLLKTVPKEEISAILASTGRSVVKPVANPAGKKRSADTAFYGEVDSWSRQDPHSTKHRNLGDHDPVIGIGFQNMNAGSIDGDDGSYALPSKEIQDHLAEVFFDYVYGQPYFLLHKPSFMRRLRSGTAPPVLVLAICAVSARFSTHPAVAHNPPFLAGEKFASEARRQLLKNFDTPNITNVTVCIILGLHEFGTCHGGRSWALGGIATRMAHALQLHKEAEQDPMGKVHPMMRPDYIHEGGLAEGYMSFTDKEIRRRCMWACFVMDRFNSSGTERPCIINECELEIQLPVHDRNLRLDCPATTEQLDGEVKDTSDAPEEEKVEKAAENMGIGAYMIRVVSIYGRVVKYLNQGGKEKDARKIWDPESQFCELNSEIFQFMEDLPAEFQYTKENIESHAAEKQFGQFVFLHVAFYQIRLFLHRSTLTTPGIPSGQSPAMPPDFANRATKVTLEAATKIAEILQDSQDRGARVVAPFTGYCAFNASLVHLARMFDPEKRIQIEAKRHMETCLRFLLQLKQYWGLFCSITDNLKILYRRLQDIATGEGPIPGHQEASRMLKYGDWFLKYPAGLSSSDFEDSRAKARLVEEMRSPSNDPALSHRPDLQTADEFFARLGPRIGARGHFRQGPPPISTHYQKHHMHTSASVHSKSPVSMYGKSPAVQISPQENIQQSSQHTTHPVPTSTISQNTVEIPQLKLEARIPQGQGHGPHINIGPQQSYSDGSFAQPQDTSQLSPPMPAGIGNIPTPGQFPSYTPSDAPAPRIDDAQTSFERSQPVSQQSQQSQQQQQQQPYPYDSYPAGSDSSLIAALSTGLWQGFEQPINTSEINIFPEQNSSAWFMPFNSMPHGCYEASTTLSNVGHGLMEATGGGSNEVTGPGAAAAATRPREGAGEIHGEAGTTHIMSVGPGQVVPGGVGGAGGGGVEGGSQSPATYHNSRGLQ